MLGRAYGVVKNRPGGRRALICGGLFALLPLVLVFMPLFDLLGYDFSFAVCLAAMLAGVDIGAGVVASFRRTDSRPDLVTCLRHALGLSLLVLAAPLLL